MEQKLIRFIKFHGYLFFGCALFFALRELWLLTINSLFSNRRFWINEQESLTRSYPTVRWIFALLWLVALAVMYTGMRWEEPEYLRPAKYLFSIEILIVLVQDFIRSINNEPNERLILNAEYLFFFSAIVIYVLYTFQTLGSLFNNRTATIVNSPSKVHIICCESSAL
ncbi:uncharacterized protein LOC131694319 [Topomyia yanbarensis]|uniref:uncharacterized protein LOC131694319 n=1 Tax=Topomyia yanbarensis TaxID=2498891 RepID=UPI00273AF14F|nr:uncharacterized protein LOC131694319 [Topomyia yanbarensis]